MRERLEVAYEDEKQKSALILRCSRIYHDFLRSQDRKLYEHLMQMQVSPELHLMRWLRCMLSREFEVEPVLHFWDYMLGGVYLQYTESHQNSWNPKQQLEIFPDRDSDPFLNLDILCVSMIVSIRELLLESDFSMCLAYLLNYEPPEDLSLIITKGIQIKRDILNIEESKNDDDGFGFEDLDGEVNQMRANSATKLEKIAGKK